MLYVALYSDDACPDEQSCIIITAWNAPYHTIKAEYQSLRSKFEQESAAMLREFEKNGGEGLDEEIERYVKSVDIKRTDLESWAKY